MSTSDAATTSHSNSRFVDRYAERPTASDVLVTLYRFRTLLKHLVLKDLKLKYRGSFFGFLWSLANPLLMIVVYWMAFTYILRIRGSGFVFYLMIGSLSWTFFAASAGMATGAIVDNPGLLKSVAFPRAILPISTVLFNFAQYVLTLIVFLPVMMLWFRASLSWLILLLPVFLALQVLFTVGVALALATGTTFFRDVRHLLEVALSVMFWTTPIVYDLDNVPEALRSWILLSPMSPFVVAYHRLLYNQQWPEPAVWYAATAYAIASLTFGAWIFTRFQEQFAERI
jgi:ABC-type polysaccharide/polyol phosphate export permease